MAAVGRAMLTGGVTVPPGTPSGGARLNALDGPRDRSTVHKLRTLMCTLMCTVLRSEDGWRFGRRRGVF
jgi:hypothetical protein